MHLDHVPSRARDRRNDRRLPAGNPIEQGRFARIGWPCNGDHQALPQPLATGGARKRLRNFRTQALRDG